MFEKGGIGQTPSSLEHYLVRKKQKGHVYGVVNLRIEDG